MIQKDSVNTSLLPKELSIGKSSDSISHFFTNNSKVEMLEIKRLEYEAIPLWIHLSLFFWVIVIIIARQSYTLRLRQIFIAFLKPKQIKQLHREGNLLKQIFPALLLLLYAFVISLFTFLFLNQHFIQSFYFSSGEGFLFLYTAVILYHLLKFITIKFFGILFDTGSLSTLYLLDHFVFYISGGIILFPLIILYIYSEIQAFLYLAVIVLITLWVFRIIRAVFIGLDCINYSRYYLFLYLCTLEVLPIFLLYKLFFQFM